MKKEVTLTVTPEEVEIALTEVITNLFPVEVSDDKRLTLCTSGIPTAVAQIYNALDKGAITVKCNEHTDERTGEKIYKYYIHVNPEEVCSTIRYSDGVEMRYLNTMKTEEGLPF